MIIKNMPDDAHYQNILKSVELDKLFRIGIHFYKEKNGKALHLAYQDNLKLVAYTKQVLNGPLNKTKMPEIGYFDVIGNDRRDAWKALGEMAKEDAMRGFIDILQRNCPSFIIYVAAHMKDSHEGYRERPNNGHVPYSAYPQPYDPDRKFLENEDFEEVIENGRSQQTALKETLYAQIYPQLMKYAQEQCPNDEPMQSALISQLAQQYWDRYTQEFQPTVQVPPPFIDYASYDKGFPNGQPTHSPSPQNKLDLSHVTKNTGTSPHPYHNAHVPNFGYNGTDGMIRENGGFEKVDISALSDTHSSPNLGGESDGPGTEDVSDDGVIASASMWNRKEIKEFKADVKKNYKECIVKIGQGETVTIRVPTHDDGNSLFWEFSTDYYDIAFGIYFEWTEPSSNKISIMVSESSGEEEEEEDEEETDQVMQGMQKMDLENGTTTPSSAFSHNAPTPKDNLDSKSLPHLQSINNGPVLENIGGDCVSIPSRGLGPVIDEIVPVYRRNCHEEVFAGTHSYPGRGVYLLKFDNSYSLWRSKTLYYKIYYTK